MPSSNEFYGKVILVTGAYQGIGKAVVELLVAREAIVVAADIAFSSSELVEQTANLFQIHLDVSSQENVNDVVGVIEDKLGHIEYLASVAGILHMGSILEQGNAEWQNTFAVNCHGPFYLCQAVAKRMQQCRRGSIVAVGSNAAQTPRVNMGSYCASKAALTALIKNLALELAPYNVRCNLVAPGSTDTQMQQQLWRDTNGAAKTIAGDLEQFKLGIPLGRIATPFDIANTILFLLSDQAKHITMSNLLVDGGATLGH